MAKAVEVKSLIKKFHSFHAVDDISFDVERGEIFGFLGANGAGKSTTIKILCGIQPQSSGTAQVLGIDVDKNPKKVKNNIGYMSQKFSLYEDLTVAENINFFAGIRKIRGKELHQRRESILTMADLKGKENLITSSLPMGWKQKLALGCSIIHRPKILFLDEPTAGVDPKARRIFWDIIFLLKNQGTTVFVTSHYMDEVEMCDRIVMMHRGKIAAMGAPQELKKDIIKGKIINLIASEPEKVLNLLENQEHIERMDPYGKGFHLVTDTNDSKMTQALILRLRELLQSHGISVQKAEVTPTTLEDVFVYLIGELEKKNYVA